MRDPGGLCRTLGSPVWDPGGSGVGHRGPMRDPGDPRAGDGCETCRMPVLDPNPQNGQKKMLLVFGSFFAIFVIIAIIATIASP